MEERNYFLYKHTNKFNNKVYIGITSQTPKKRWLYGKGYTNNDYFTKSINKYGWNNFKHEILYENLTKEEAEQKEIELIFAYKSNQRKYGYNLDNGGKLNRFTKETKTKMSNSHKGKISWNKGKHIGIGEDNNFYGHHHTEETKKKISKANTGRKKTIEQKKKISDSCKKTWKEKIANGYTLNEIARKKISKANKGRISTFKGHHHTEEAKTKIRLAHLGKPLNKQALAKAQEKNKKPIICYNKKMELIKEYSSSVEAGMDLNIETSNICKCLKGKTKTSGGYIFKYKEVNNDK